MVRVVRGEQNAVPGRLEREDFVHHPALVAEIEARGRLVEHDELRLLRQRAGEQHKLPLAAGQLRVGPLAQVRDAEARERADRGIAVGGGRRLNRLPWAVRPISTTVSTVNAKVGTWDCGT